MMKTNQFFKENDKTRPITPPKGIDEKQFKSTEKKASEKIEVKLKKQSKSEPKKLIQITKPDEEIDHTVDVMGYKIEIPEDKDEYDIVDEFLEKNHLFEKVGKINPNTTSPLADRIEISMEKNIGTVESPSGSCYLTTDGKWVGGEGIYGYDEDHRPQIRKALVYAALDLEEPDWQSGDESSKTMVKACEMTGMVRVGARHNLSLDIYQPLTSQQVRAIKDYVLENNIPEKDVVLDLNNRMKDVSEQRIYNQILPERYEEE